MAHLNYATTNNRATVRERDRNISNAASTTADSYRVVVMLISHLPTSYTLLPAQSDPSSPKYFQLSYLPKFSWRGRDFSINSAYIFTVRRTYACNQGSIREYITFDLNHISRLIYSFVSSQVKYPISLPFLIRLISVSVLNGLLSIFNYFRSKRI